MPRLLPKLNWHCASLLTRINKSQEIILTWEATAKFEQGVMSIVP